MVTVRQATPADRPAVSAVLAEAWWRHGTSAMEDQIALLHGGVTSMAFSRGHCTALLGFSVREPAGEPVEIWADLVSLAVSGGQTPAKILRALLDGALESLQAKSVTGLVCLTGDDWLRSALSEVGFL
jgi:predicted N-acetyltransferase YhbS